MALATHYMESQIATTNDDYVLSLCNYALTLAKSPAVRDIQTTLKNYAIVSGKCFKIDFIWPGLCCVSSIKVKHISNSVMKLLREIFWTRCIFPRRLIITTLILFLVVYTCYASKCFLLVAKILDYN